MWPHTHTEEQIPRRSAHAARRALSCKADALTILHARRDLHAQTTCRSIGKAHLDRAFGPLVRLGQRDLDFAFDIRSGYRPATTCGRTPEKRSGVEVCLPLAEQRAEEIREPSRVAAVERVRAGLARVDPLESARLLSALPEALPLRTDGVVALALLGIGEDLVGLVDLLEALLRLGFLVDVRMVLARELAVRLLDLLGARILRDAECLVVVLVLDRHSYLSQGRNPLQPPLQQRGHPCDPPFSNRATPAAPPSLVGGRRDDRP